jgi:hypothetical protein
MDLHANPNLVHLSSAGPGQRALHLPRASGYRLAVLSGEVWITQTGRIEDYVLRAGDALTLDSPGAAVVTSFGPADVEVIAPAAPPAPATPAPLPWPPAISAETIERAQRQAHELRSQAIDDLLTAGVARLRDLARDALSRIGLRSGTPCEDCPA